MAAPAATLFPLLIVYFSLCEDAFICGDVGYVLVGRWRYAHFVEGLVGPVVVQVNVVALKAVEVVGPVQHFHRHYPQLGHGQPVLGLIVKVTARLCQGQREDRSVYFWGSLEAAGKLANSDANSDRISQL